MPVKSMSSDVLISVNNVPIIDVRSPKEFSQGHIFGAHNIPLFENEERAEVGKTYKIRGKEAAIELGLKFVGPKLYNFIFETKKISPEKNIIIHCWRGGMRSESFAWLLDLAGFIVCKIDKGYKAYRNFVLQTFDKKFQIIILGGMTGSGKSEILKSIAEAGEQIIDLESIANHKGSAFGQIGMDPQPTQEQFENNLSYALNKLDFNKPIWMEDESNAVGHVRIPNALFMQMRNAAVVNLEVNKEERIKHLVNGYAHAPFEELKLALEKIQKRLGGLNTTLALEALEKKDFYTVVLLSLEYYDKAYNFGLSKRTPTNIHNLAVEKIDAKENTNKIIEHAYRNIINRS